MRTLIVDDEPVAAERMRLLCAGLPDMEVAGVARDGPAAVAAIEKLAPDLVLLDIAMPGLDGLAVARAVEAGGRRPAIVFCTAYAQHALAAFDVSAVDYLLKPVSAERLRRAVERARAGRSSPAAPAPPPEPGWAQEIWVPHRGAMTRVRVADIVRIDAEDDYVRLHTERAGYLLHEAIARLERKLDPAVFLRLRRSVIVRTACVRGLRHEGQGAWSALLNDGEAVRIGPTYLAAVRARLGASAG